MLQIKQFSFNPFQENTYLLFDETREVLIIDPGCSTQTEFDRLDAEITQSDLKPIAIINTHCHVDHVLGNQIVKEHYGIPLIIHESDKILLEAVKNIAPAYGINDYVPASPDQFIKEGGIVSVGNSKLEVLHVPGHSPGHIALYHQDSGICIAGDVLFNGSIGRTDLPGGDYDILMDSIKSKLFQLPDDVRIYPGHGPYTTIGQEKASNPFCAIR